MIVFINYSIHENPFYRCEHGYINTVHENVQYTRLNINSCFMVSLTKSTVGLKRMKNNEEIDPLFFPDSFKRWFRFGDINNKIILNNNRKLDTEITQ